MPVDLPGLIRAVRTHPGVTAKSEIGLVSEVFQSTDWLAGPGDDGAVVTDQGVSLVVGGEAILPSFVAADPYGAGVAAVTTNLNDLAAMGAWPLALVDTVTGPRPVIQRVLEGMRWASGLYQVPVVGGHLTITAGPPGLAAFGLGRAGRPLSVLSAEPGQSLVVGCCVDGRMRADFPFFPSFDERGERLAGDIRLLADGADRGWVAAAKDVSMAGLVGSLAMLLECNRLGVTLDLDALPVPAGVTLEQWITCFPCFAFLLCVPPGREQECLRAFAGRDLAAAVVGTLDGTGQLRVCTGGRAATAFDLTTESVTNLARPAADPPAVTGLPHRPGRRSRGLTGPAVALSVPASPGRSACAGEKCRHRPPGRRPAATPAVRRM
jgi:selenophosphate synthetase-related protein